MQFIILVSEYQNHQKYLYGLTKEPKIRDKKVWIFNSTIYTANVNRQTTDKLLFSCAIITGKNV